MKKQIAPTSVLLMMSILAPLHSVSADTSEGEKLYGLYCVQCHGTQGDGKGVNASTMSVQPRSHIEKTEMAQRTDQELFKVIAEGGPSINKSVLMPAWKDNMTEEQIHALVKHLRKLCCSE